MGLAWWVCQDQLIPDDSDVGYRMRVLTKWLASALMLVGVVGSYVRFFEQESCDVNAKVGEASVLMDTQAPP